MSAWKRIALEKLPECRQVIESADNPMALWIELQLKFEEVYVDGYRDEDLIRRFFEYARWCIKCPGDAQYLSDAGTAAICVFYEHLPERGVIRRDLPRWITREEFDNLRETFRYHLSDREFAEFEGEFLEHWRR